jgi:hypothetical protein
VRTTNNLYTVTNNATHVFYARYNSTSTSTFDQNFLFRVGQLETGCAITWQSEQVVRSAGGSGTATWEPSVAISTTGQAFISYVNVTQSNSVQKPFAIRSSGIDYSTWTEDTQLSTTHEDQWRTTITKMASGRVLTAYWDGDGGQNLLTRTYDGSWGSQVVASAFSISEGIMLFHEEDIVYALYANGDNDQFELVTRDSGGTWSARETVASAEATSNLMWTATYDVMAKNFHFFYYNYTNNNIGEATGQPGSWPVSKTVRFTTLLATSSHAITSHRETGQVGTDSFYAVFWTDNGDGGDHEIKAATARIRTIPTGGTLPPPPDSGVPAILLFFPGPTTRAALLPDITFSDISREPFLYLFIAVAGLVLTPYFAFKAKDPFEGISSDFEDRHRLKLANRQSLKRYRKKRMRL